MKNEFLDDFFKSINNIQSDSNVPESNEVETEIIDNTKSNNIEPVNEKTDIIQKNELKRRSNSISFDKKSIVNGIIISEILKKPKSLRHR